VIDHPTDDPQAAIRDLGAIRRIVEASGRFTILSGAAAVVAGGSATVGALLTHRVLTAAGGVSMAGRAVLVQLAEIWLGVFIVAAAATLLGTLRRSRLEDRAILPRLIGRIAFGLVPSFVVAAALTLALISRGAVDLVAPLWILSYGAAAVTAGLFSVRSVQVLGACFLAAGLVSLLWLPHLPALTLGVTFGGFHVIYGGIVWRSHGA
jgi:hypothetical protein